MNDDLFDNDTVDNSPLEDKNYLEELVGEDKKFKDLEALARAKIESDNFIELLKHENKTVRDELNSRIKLEEFLDRMNQSNTPPSNNQNPPGNEPSKDTSSAIAAEDLEKLLDRKLTQREQENLRSNNIKEVKQVLKDKLGPNYTSKVQESLSSLGMDEQAGNQLAATNPKAFYKLLGIDTPTRQENFQSPPRSQVNTEGFKPNTNSEKKYSYYKEMMTKDFSRYMSPKIQSEIMAQAKKLGDAFYD